MALKNPWVGYADRSYIRIKNSVLGKLGTIVPEATDHSESNILVVIVSMFSGAIEMLNYYIDNMAREAFVTTARRYSSMVKHTRLIDYRIKAAIPASVVVNITLPETFGFVTPGQTSINIPSGTIFSTNNGIFFISTKDVNFTPSPINKTFQVPLEQKEQVMGEILGTTSGDSEQIFVIGPDYAHNSAYIKIGGEVWERKETLGRSGPTDKHYIIEISAQKDAFIKFGDGINGALPIANKDVVADYYTTAGAEGNVDINTIVNTELDFTTIIDTTEEIIITNPLQAVAGTDYEGIERIRRSAPLSLRTLDRAVTPQDFKDITILAPGVDKAMLDYTCGEETPIYISPNGGGIAQTPLLDSTEEYVDKRRTINTRIKVLPAGESYIHIKIRAKAKFRRDAIVTKQDIINALVNQNSYENSDINKPIRRSDIIALVDNLEKVEYLTLEEIYITPYMRPLNHNNNLISTINIKPGSVTVVQWRLQYTGGVMKLFKDNQYLVDIPFSTSFTDSNNIFTIIIEPGPYINGDEWEFKTFPYNDDIEVNDYTIPITKESNLDITVDEQLTLN